MKKLRLFAITPVLAVLMFVSACQEETHTIKRAQLVGYENHQLKKQIEQNNTDIAGLKQQNQQAQQKIQTLQTQLEQATTQANTTADENKQLKKQAEQKDSKIKSLTQQLEAQSEENLRSQQMLFISKLTEMLGEYQRRLAKYEPVDANIPPMLEQ